MNAPWDAAQALLALVTDCLAERCEEYTRKYVDTARPVADCDTLAVVIGRMNAASGSCAGRGQMNSSLDIHLIRCCDPQPTLTDAGGYTPPTPEAIEKAAACLTRDVWAVFECIVCQACDALNNLPGVTVCCDRFLSPPSVTWSDPQGGCRGAVISIPAVFTVCC